MAHITQAADLKKYEYEMNEKFVVEEDEDGNKISYYFGSRKKQSQNVRIPLKQA